MAGNLSVTRALGDLIYHEYGLLVEPYVTEINIQNNQKSFVVMASDGLWDVFDDQKVGDMIN